MISICNTLAEEENCRRSLDLIGVPRLQASGESARLCEDASRLKDSPQTMQLSETFRLNLMKFMDKHRN